MVWCGVAWGSVVWCRVGWGGVMWAAVACVYTCACLSTCTYGCVSVEVRGQPQPQALSIFLLEIESLCAGDF